MGGSGILKRYGGVWNFEKVWGGTQVAYKSESAKSAEFVVVYGE
jgi:hypothetical protein